MPPVLQIFGNGRFWRYVPVGLFCESAGKKKKKRTNTQNNEGTVSMNLEWVLTGGSLTCSHFEIHSANSLPILISGKAFVGVCLVLVYVDNLSKWRTFIISIIILWTCIVLYLYFVNREKNSTRRSDGVKFWQSIDLPTSRMCSWFLESYLLLYFEESSSVPLLRSHVTVGAGSPLTIAFKRAFLPASQTLQGVLQHCCCQKCRHLRSVSLTEYDIYPPERLSPSASGWSRELTFLAASAQHAEWR